MKNIQTVLVCFAASVVLCSGFTLLTPKETHKYELKTKKAARKNVAAAVVTRLRKSAICGRLTVW
ncbi:MAG: hypothetical protein M0D57_02185 [Sphingobacteriales bacterium JAD_PAG50586_3]|nr:MAG: hypothetical protein M0D57_02185 [Sphingobacteriales bacterium JAD_PAG50586_3]